MKHSIRLPILLLLVLIAPADMLAQSAGGFDTARIESDTTFDIPTERMEAVWMYLSDRYVKETAFLASIDPLLSATASDEFFIDTYFDTNALPLLESGASLRYRRRTNRSNPEDRKNGRELVQLKFGSVQEEALARQEFKYPVDIPEIINSANDKHPFFRFLSKGSRAEITERLRGDDVDATGVRPIFTLRQERRRVAITRNGEPFIGFSLDGSEVERLWANVRFDQMELELNEIAFTEGDAETRRALIAVRDRLVADLLKEFPELKENPETKYEKAFARFEKKIPWYRSLIRMGIL